MRRSYLLNRNFPVNDDALRVPEQRECFAEQRECFAYIFVKVGPLPRFVIPSKSGCVPMVADSQAKYLQAIDDALFYSL